MDNNKDPKRKGLEENQNFDPFANRPNKRKQPKFSVFWLFLLIISAIFLMQIFGSGSQKPVITAWREVRNQMLANNEVEKILVIRNTGRVEVTIKKECLDKYADRFKRSINPDGPHFYYDVGSIESFEQQLAEAQQDTPESEKIYPDFVDRPNYWGDIMSWIFPLLLLVLIWMFFFRRINRSAAGGAGTGGLFNVGKSKAQLFDRNSNTQKIDFKDVAGLEEAKIEVMEIVDFLKNPKKYTNLGGKIPKGALLVGPPGTGKTLLAKAVAGEANVPFFSMSGSDFVEMFVGVGASRVRDLFRQAKEKSPCIIFIDEIDAIGRARGKNPNFGGNDERENTLNQLLTEMDGFASNQGVIIMAATNRADILDRALLRAGRFDRQIHVELPDNKERLEIFKVHLKPLKLEPNFDITFLAKQTPGFSGADIANVCNEAALIAARGNKQAVEKQDFLDAIDRIVGGMEKKSKIISKDEKRTIAYHEAGHATVSWLLEYAHPLVKVSIIPRGSSLGAAWYLPEERQITTTEQLFDEMCALLGGRAAEDLVLGQISTGALNDLERVSKQAYAMIAYYGMGDQTRNISYYDSSGQSEYSFSKPYSDKTSEVIDEEVKKLIDKAYNRAKQILTQHAHGHAELAELLLEREVIFSEDLEKIFGPRKSLTREQILSLEMEEELNQKTDEQQLEEQKPE